MSTPKEPSSIVSPHLVCGIESLDVRATKSIFLPGAVPTEKISHWIQHHQSTETIGAHDIFIGQVRADEVDGKKVSYIDYTAYEDMANKVYQQIAQDILSKFKITCIHTLHSLGQVSSGQISLAVIVSAPHRQDCFSACRELVERIKGELPVWGKEVFEDHTTAWKENKFESDIQHD
jgi:molybdopterin synthase catalytic subunit